MEQLILDYAQMSSAEFIVWRRLSHAIDILIFAGLTIASYFLIKWFKKREWDDLQHLAVVITCFFMFLFGFGIWYSIAKLVQATYYPNAYLIEEVTKLLKG